MRTREKQAEGTVEAEILRTVRFHSCP